MLQAYNLHVLSLNASKEWNSMAYLPSSPGVVVSEADSARQCDCLPAGSWCVGQPWCGGGVHNNYVTGLGRKAAG